MKTAHRLALAAVAAAVGVLALSWYLHSWGGIALVAVAAAGFAWYRVQVARGEAAERFFGDAGEDTRLTGFQAGSPSEMPPLDRNPGHNADPPRR
ncbi:hypothetical protein JJB11_17945 [Ramlibacter ginsenosidimutans]|uniref:Uncharacterized protein n=1 Tax=Ramlibacter ginsenosidimutans TaxID=502333 RepID=A0A934WNS3_9BURK|nr:hypothetical protein [Ramlibacter ginsenosidimutans]MBK6007986.1 hypothetical protein [Ramlibacter ginsenosidimutans]